MRRLYLIILIGFVILVSFTKIKEVYAYTIDFEGLADLTPVNTQYSGLGVEFLGSTILTAGISLNEFEFPPNSGTNVVYDESGPILLTFSAPVLNAGGYFTYLSPVTLTAYDSLLNMVGTMSSAYSSNMALSGDLGSSPNEFLQIAFAGGISSLELSGDILGSSFVLDNFTAKPSSVPEPATLLLLGSGIVGLFGCRRIKRALI